MFLIRLSSKSAFPLAIKSRCGANQSQAKELRGDVLLKRFIACAVSHVVPHELIRKAALVCFLSRQLPLNNHVRIKFYRKPVWTDFFEERSLNEPSWKPFNSAAFATENNNSAPRLTAARNCRLRKASPLANSFIAKLSK